MTQHQVDAIAWVARQYAWERRLAQLRFEALRARAEPEGTHPEERADGERRVAPVAAPTPTAA